MLAWWDENPNQDVIFLHYIVNQESLCKLVSWLNHVVHHAVKPVNFIRARELQHRQFITVLEKTDADHQDLLYHSSPLVKFGQSVSMIVWASRTGFVTIRLLSTHFLTWMSWTWSYREGSVCAQHAQRWLSFPGKFWIRHSLRSPHHPSWKRPVQKRRNTVSHWMHCTENSAVGFLILK